MNTSLSKELQVNQERLARLLGLPDNLGIWMRPLRIGQGGAMLVWAEGLVQTESLHRDLLAPLAGLTSPDQIPHAIPVAQRSTGDLIETGQSVLHGFAALLIDGSAEAWLLDIRARPETPAGGSAAGAPRSEPFTRDLTANLALIRQRLPELALRASPIALKRPRAGQVALLYLEGKADPGLVSHVTAWAEEHAGEEVAATGFLSRIGATYGLLPRFDITRWPQKAAMLIESGYVLLLTDRVPYGHAAPVTAASWFVSPIDHELKYPIQRWIVRVRLLCYLVVLFLPGAVVALMNYHHEMVPTGFMLAVASARESAAFGIVFEVAAVEGLVEVARLVTYQLPDVIGPGHSLIAVLLLLLTAVLTGFVGPVPALTGALSLLFSLALPSLGGTVADRIWRYFIIAGAILMGFFGMAAVFGWILIYLCQARSWGVPFLGPSGWYLSGLESPASHRPEGRSITAHRGHGA